MGHGFQPAMLVQPSEASSGTVEHCLKQWWIHCYTLDINSHLCYTVKSCKICEPRQLQPLAGTADSPEEEDLVAQHVTETLRSNEEISKLEAQIQSLKERSHMSHITACVHRRMTTLSGRINMNQHKSTKHIMYPGLASESFVCFVSHLFSSMYEYKGTFKHGSLDPWLVLTSAAIYSSDGVVATHFPIICHHVSSHLITIAVLCLGYSPANKRVYMELLAHL